MIGKQLHTGQSGLALQQFSKALQRLGRVVHAGYQRYTRDERMTTRFQPRQIGENGGQVCSGVTLVLFRVGVLEILIEKVDGAHGTLIHIQRCKSRSLQSEVDWTETGGKVFEKSDLRQRFPPRKSDAAAVTNKEILVLTQVGGKRFCGNALPAQTTAALRADR